MPSTGDRRNAEMLSVMLRDEAKIPWKTCGLFATFGRRSHARDAGRTHDGELAMRRCLGIAASVILAFSATAFADGGHHAA